MSHLSCLVPAKFSIVSVLLSYGLKLLGRHRLEGISRKDEIFINCPFEGWIKDLEFHSLGGKKDY